MTMNREQLIRICLDSGVVRRDVAIKLIETIEANEREACAKHLESMSNAPDIKSYTDAIRARGEA